MRHSTKVVLAALVVLSTLASSRSSPSDASPPFRRLLQQYELLQEASSDAGQADIAGQNVSGDGSTNAEAPGTDAEAPDGTSTAPVDRAPCEAFTLDHASTSDIACEAPDNGDDNVVGTVCTVSKCDAGFDLADDSPSSADMKFKYRCFADPDDNGSKWDGTAECIEAVAMCEDFMLDNSKEVECTGTTEEEKKAEGAECTVKTCADTFSLVDDAADKGKFTCKKTGNIYAWEGTAECKAVDSAVGICEDFTLDNSKEVECTGTTVEEKKVEGAECTVKTCDDTFSLVDDAADKGKFTCKKTGDAYAWEGTAKCEVVDSAVAMCEDFTLDNSKEVECTGTTVEEKKAEGAECTVKTCADTFSLVDDAAAEGDKGKFTCTKKGDVYGWGGSAECKAPDPVVAMCEDFTLDNSKEVECTGATDEEKKAEGAECTVKTCADTFSLVDDAAGEGDKGKFTCKKTGDAYAWEGMAECKGADPVNPDACLCDEVLPCSQLCGSGVRFCDHAGDASTLAADCAWTMVCDAEEFEYFCTGFEFSGQAVKLTLSDAWEEDCNYTPAQAGPDVAADYRNEFISSYLKQDLHSFGEAAVDDPKKIDTVVTNDIIFVFDSESETTVRAVLVPLDVMKVDPPSVADQAVDAEGLRLFLKEIAGNEQTHLGKCITVEDELEQNDFELVDNVFVLKSAAAATTKPNSTSTREPGSKGGEEVEPGAVATDSSWNYAAAVLIVLAVAVVGYVYWRRKQSEAGSGGVSRWQSMEVGSTGSGGGGGGWGNRGGRGYVGL